MEILWDDSAEDKASKKKFNNWYDNFTGSAASVVARDSERLSVKDPTKWLKDSQPRKPPPRPSTPLPPGITKLLSMQTRQGLWNPCNEITDLLGGVLPDPPEDLPPHTWTTALVVVYLRRSPELHDKVKKAVDSGLAMIDDHLLHEAREQLPPYPCTFRLDEEMVRHGRWRESAQDRLQSYGFESFTTVSALQTQGLDTYPGNKPFRDRSASIARKRDRARVKAISYEHEQDLRLARAPRDGRGKPLMQARTHRAQKEETAYMEGLAREFERSWYGKKLVVGVGDVVLCCWRREDRWGTPSKRSEHSPAKVTRISTDGRYDLQFLDGDRERVSGVAPRYLLQLSSQPDGRGERPGRLKELVEQWKEPKRISEEMRRLRKLKPKKQPRAKWDDGFNKASEQEFVHGRYNAAWEKLNRARQEHVEDLVVDATLETMQPSDE